MSEKTPEQPCPGCESLRRQCSELAGELGAALAVLSDIRAAYAPGTFAHDTARMITDAIRAGRAALTPLTEEQARKAATPWTTQPRAAIAWTVDETQFGDDDDPDAD